MKSTGYILQISRFSSESYEILPFYFNVSAEILLIRFVLMAGSSYQLTGVDYSSAASTPLVSVLGIIDAQASLLHILFHHLITFLLRFLTLE